MATEELKPSQATLQGGTQSCINVATRIWFRMGETGTLPQWFGKVHPKHRTPANAILANMVLSLAVGLIVGLLLNASRSYLLIDGLVLVLVLAVLYTYVSANVAVVLYYLRQRRDEFNPVLHIAFPVISTAALMYVTIKSFQPFPGWIAKAGAAAAEADVIAGEDVS